MLCHVLWIHNMPCHATNKCYAIFSMLCHGIPCMYQCFCHNMLELCYAVLHYAMNYAMLWNVMLWTMQLCYSVKHYAMNYAMNHAMLLWYELCHVVKCYATNYDTYASNYVMNYAMQLHNAVKHYATLWNTMLCHAICCLHLFMFLLFAFLDKFSSECTTDSNSAGLKNGMCLSIYL